jgi:uncharacterized delta-60 repeat protein
MFKSQSHGARLSTRQRAHCPLLVSTLFFGLGVTLAAPGNLDADFGNDGLVRLQIGDVGADAFAVLQQPDGKLVLVGTGSAPGGSTNDFLAVRLNGNGVPDSTFSADGIASVDLAGGDDWALAAIQQPDGKLVLAGYASAANQGGDIALARFNANGALDTTFGDSGWVTLDLGSDAEAATGLIRQSSGNLVIAGYSNASGTDRMVFARFNSDGLLDPTFGTGGTTWIDYGDGSANWANTLVEQADGKLVAGGAVYGPGLRFDMGIVRVTANGIPDASFNGDGLLFVDFDGQGETVSSIAIQPDGAIVAVGYTVPIYKLALLRVNGDGSLDGTFGTGGKSVIDIGTGAYLNSIVVQADGKLAATGLRLTPYSYPDAILARFEPNGALDTNFGNGGIAIADFGEGGNGPWSIGLDLIQQTDGKLLATASVPGNFVAAVRFQDGASYPGRIGLTNTLESVVEETATSVTYTVRRSGGKTGNVSVDYATVAGSAQPGSDFVATSGRLTWNDGDVEDKAITIDLTDDPDPEVNESFLLSLTSPTGGAVLAASEATTFIQNADGPGEVAFLATLFGAPVRGTEGESDIQVSVSRFNGAQGQVSVSYVTNNSSATPGEDFVTSGTLAWADGETGTKFIEVDYLEDAVAEGRESFQIELNTPTGGVTIRSSGRRQVMIIVDNDEGFLLPDTAASANENVGTLQFAIERSGDLNRAASVDYATANGTAVAGSDYSAASGTLTWAAGDSGFKTIEISIINDPDDENDESFTVSLSNPTGGVPLAADSTASVTIVDDDTRGGGGSSGGGGGGGTTGLDLLALLGLLNAFAMRKSRRLPRESLAQLISEEQIDPRTQTAGNPALRALSRRRLGSRWGSGLAQQVEQALGVCERGVERVAELGVGPAADVELDRIHRTGRQLAQFRVIAESLRELAQPGVMAEQHQMADA